MKTCSDFDFCKENVRDLCGDVFTWVVTVFIVLLLWNIFFHSIDGNGLFANNLLTASISTLVLVCRYVRRLRADVVVANNLLGYCYAEKKRKKEVSGS
jgi:hypothetical protein